jgi:putative phosphoesterase
MRILVVADIHGNRAALEAIREPCDICLCLGDIVDYGPEPAACIEWVRANVHHCVRGNHDHGVAQNVEVQGPSGFRFLTAATRPLTVAALTAEQRRFLANLPTSRMLTLDGKRFLMVHGTPRDPMDEYVLADAEDWAPLVAGLNADFVLVGHTHQLYSLEVNGTTVVNPGSVGLTRSGDPRATYAVIDDGRVELKHQEYPVEETIAALDGFVSDPRAKQMLADVYRGRGLVARWATGK